MSFIFTPCLYYKTQHVSVCKCIPNKAFKKSAFCMIASVTAYYRGINTPNFTCENRQKQKTKKKAIQVWSFFQPVLRPPNWAPFQVSGATWGRMLLEAEEQCPGFKLNPHPFAVCLSHLSLSLLFYPSLTSLSNRQKANKTKDHVNAALAYWENICNLQMQTSNLCTTFPCSLIHSSISFLLRIQLRVSCL